MSQHISVPLIRKVRERARHRCEFCLLPQETQEAIFHVDHIVPRAADGATIESNLALACVSCSLHKSARIVGVDPRTEKLARIFDPRNDQWHEHFAFTKAWRIRGRTPVGRATVEALHMNRKTIVLIRRELALRGHFPTH